METKSYILRLLWHMSSHQPLLIILSAGVVLISGCDNRTTLSSPPVLKPGQGFFANSATLDTEAMLGMCSTAISASDTGQLEKFSDAQIANGTCEMTVMAVELIGRSADPGQTCVLATKDMIVEFKRRFPDHDPKEVAGHC